MCCPCLSDLCLIILSVLFPPLPVWIRRGLCSCDSLINIALCILGYFPGLIHSWYIIAKYPPYSSRRDRRVYYVHATDLESQRNGESGTTCVHNHYHSPITQQPSEIQTPTVNYGSTSEAGPSGSNPVPPPPAYSELDNKTQH